MRYLLDTNVMIALLKGSPKTVSRIRAYSPSDIGVSSIVLHELFYGAFKSMQSDANISRLDALQLEVIEFDKEDARQAGEIRALLARRGVPIGPYDVLIAGQAKSRDLTLVTRNTKEFQRVDGLKLDDWEL